MPLKKKGLQNIIVFAILLAFLYLNYESKFFFPILWSSLTLLSIYIFFRSQKRLYIFNPINLFCTFYASIPITSFYYIYTDFDNAIFIDKYLLKESYVTLFSYACFYYLLGLLCIIAGYKIYKEPIIDGMRFPNGKHKGLSDKLIRYTAYALSCIGLLNFLYNVFKFSGGNILNYLSNVALRHHEFSDVGGTTAAYHLLYLGAYLILYLYLKNKKQLLELVIIIAVSTIVKASVGRIFGTVVHLMSFIVMIYFAHISRKTVVSEYNKRFVLGSCVFLFLGGIFYFYRVYSAISVGFGSEVSLREIINEFSNQIGIFVFDKGNTPNVALFMKIIDSWQEDFGYLFGKSLFSGILPLNLINDHGYNSSIIVQELWYDHLPSGALPTTAVGELYMNFGPLGIPVFMFVIGFLIKLGYVSAIKHSSFTSFLILTLLSLSFIFIYPKVDFSNFRLYWVVLGYFPFVVVRICRNVSSR